MQLNIHSNESSRLHGSFLVVRINDCAIALSYGCGMQQIDMYLMYLMYLG